MPEQNFAPTFTTLSIPMDHPNGAMLEKMHFLLHSALTQKNGLFLQNLVYLNDNLLEIYKASENEEDTVKKILEVYEISYK